MKSRSTAIYADCSIMNKTKSTGVVTTSLSRPFFASESFSVILDTLNGDHKSIYPHEFKRTYTQNYSGIRISESFTDYTVMRGALGYSFPSGSFVPDDVNSADLTSLYNNALQSLYDQLRSSFVESSEGLDLSVDIAEAHQVKKMIGGASDLLSQFGRSPFRSTRALVKAFGSDSRKWAEAWLTWQYGVRPLFSSIYGLFEAIVKRRLYNYVTIVGKARERSTGPVGSRTGTFGEETTEIVDRDYRARCMIVAEYALSNSTMQRLGGYTSLNPVSIAWELTPFSFVFDWVWNIGGYLRSLEGALLYGSGFKRGYVVYGVKSECTAYARGGYNRANNVSLFIDGSAKRSQSWKRRLVLSSAPYPYRPRVRVDLGSKRLFSAASLLRVSLK